MPSPPPRKIKPTAWLKEVHSKQLSSLQQREQQLLDIIEDVRIYSRQRADIERLYGQSLQKLSTQLLSKKELFQLVDVVDSNDEHRTIHSAWKYCLEETEKIGSARVKAADVYNQTVSERSKLLKSHKSTAIKKALEQLGSLQTDLAQSVKEFGVEHKQYTDDEVVAHEARNKANVAGQRLTNKDTGMFSSVNTLKKSQAKTFAKMEQANGQSASSRNGYLLQLSAVNAHTARIHSKHIPSLFKTLDDGVYDELSSCISVIAQTEIDSCTNILSTHNRVVSTCDLVTPQYNLDCFLQANKVFSEQITFTFEPVHNDPECGLSINYGEDQRLERETRNWARKVAKETRSLADLHDKINQVTNKGVQGDAMMEAELAKLHAWVRRSEIAKLKAEARLDLLRTVNMPVDEMLSQATSEHESMRSLPDNQSFTSRGSTHSADTFDSFGESVSDQVVSQRPSHLSITPSASSSCLSTLSTAVAIYDYKANEGDELDLVEGEILSIIDHGTGDGWLRAQNSSGLLGMVPENYIQAYEETADVDSQQQQDTYTEQQQAYTEQQQQHTHTEQQQVYTEQRQAYTEQQQAYTEQRQGYTEQHAYTEQTPTAHNHVPSLPTHTGMGYVRALYDYNADGADELSFSAGQIITLLSRDENGIDDGYWKGDVDGVQGMFPSIVVEEIEDSWAADATEPTPHYQLQEWQQEDTTVTPVAPPPPEETVEPPSTAAHTFSGSYQPSVHQSIPSTQRSPIKALYRPAPSLPVEEEVEQRVPYQTAASEFYPSQQPRSAPTHDITAAISAPVAASRTATKASAANDSEAARPELPSRTYHHPQLPPKPTIDYSRKPSLYNSSSLDGVDMASPTPLAPSHTASSSVLRSPSPPQPTRRRPPSPPASHPVVAPAVPPSPAAPRPNLYSESNVNVRSHSSMPTGYPEHSMYPEEQAGTPDSVESLRFRQRQPIPHHYYLEQSQNRHSSAGHAGSDGLQREHPSDMAGHLDRVSSARSFSSLSSSDSRDDKQLPIRMPGRRAEESCRRPASTTGGMSVQEAARLMPQGLVNPSYRVATMAVDAMPDTNPARSGGRARPTAQRRQGGLPGHVRQGIVQGRKILSDAASDSAAAAHQPMEKHVQKNETAV